MFGNIFLNVTKAFLNTNPSIDNVIAFANVDDMLIPLEINQTQINMSKPPNVPHDKFAALFLPQEYFEERKKKNHSFSQESCAAEIRSISGHTCRLNQLVVKGQPKEGEKTVRYWVMNEKRKKHIQKTGEDPIETVILDDNESTDNDE